MPIDPSDLPKTKAPPEREEMIGEHTKEQAETLLSGPIMIPRNPISMNVRMIVIVFLADLVFVVLFGLLLGGLSLGGVSIGSGIIVMVVVLIAVRFTLLLLVLVKMATNWGEFGYYLTDRALIIRHGIANVTENTYELTNIRQVYMFQDFMGRLYDYGHVQLVFASMGLEEIVRLTDLKDPSHYKTLFEKYLG